jgi:hypothetical protein
MDSTDLIVAAFVAVILSIVLGIAYIQTKARDERLARQAEKRGGEIRKGGLFRLTELRIPLKDVVIAIRTVPGSKHSPPKTIAQVKLDSPRLPAVRILRNDFLQKALTAFGKERLPTNDEEFDSQWVVQADDQFVVQQLVTAEFKARLAEHILRSLDIHIQPQEASFTITAIPSDDEGYDNFIDTVVLVLQKIL